ncbi:MAG: hypothetical protein C4297_02730 [Gemmataceae bacterium]
MAKSSDTAHIRSGSTKTGRPTCHRAARLTDHGSLSADASLCSEEPEEVLERPGIARIEQGIADKPSTLVPADAILGYRLIQQVGQGGLATVYLAEQLGCRRRVAIKLVHAGPFADGDARRRFQKEVEVLSALSHPHIVHLHEAGERDGMHYMVLEYVERGPLRAQLDAWAWPNSSPRSRASGHKARDIAALLMHLAQAVAAVHNAGYLHGDITPGNVLLTKDNQPKLSDFSLARRLEEVASEQRSGSITGTLPYLAPEQTLGQEHTTVASDIYALGAVLYELLTGQPPFRGTTAFDLLWAIRHEKLQPPRSMFPDIPRDLEAICLKCLAKDPHKRYANAEELVRDLSRFLQGKRVRAYRYTVWERMARLAKSREFSLVSLVAVIGIVAGSSLSGVLWLRLLSAYPVPPSVPTASYNDDVDTFATLVRQAVLACEATNKLSSGSFPTASATDWDGTRRSLQAFAEALQGLRQALHNWPATHRDIAIPGGATPLSRHSLHRYVAEQTVALARHYAHQGLYRQASDLFAQAQEDFAHLAQAEPDTQYTLWAAHCAHDRAACLLAEADPAGEKALQQALALYRRAGGNLLEARIGQACTQRLQALLLAQQDRLHEALELLGELIDSIQSQIQIRSVDALSRPGALAHEPNYSSTKLQEQLALTRLARALVLANHPARLAESRRHADMALAIFERYGQQFSTSALIGWAQTHEVLGWLATDSQSHPTSMDRADKHFLQAQKLLAQAKDKKLSGADLALCDLQISYATWLLRHGHSDQAWQQAQAALSLLPASAASSQAWRLRRSAILNLLGQATVTPPAPVRGDR